MASVVASSKTFLERGLPLLLASSRNAHAPVGKWLFGTAAMVVSMIHVGGVTRLTQSGLSMTSWSPLGSRPPLTRDEWETEFDRYKQFPEWQQRQSMTLDEFKFIYGWEYGHRMLGRTIGLVFVLPWAYFSLRGRIPKGYQARMVGLLAMGGTQGLVGWWMVKSGLGEDRRGDKQEIRVKPIRLASHLSMAVATYGALLWTGWDVLGIQNEKFTTESVSKLSKDAIRQASRLRMGAVAVTSLTAVTMVSGALVAGNDAGRAYNTFPLMDGRWIPSEMLDTKQPWHVKSIENTATVQWNHRVLGSVTAVSAVALVAAGLGPGKAKLVTPQVRRGLAALCVAAGGQFSLGVTTLLQYVPLTLAAAHQIGSVVVFSCGLYVVHSLRYARPAMLRAARQMAQSA